jgi:plastocyanin
MNLRVRSITAAAAVVAVAAGGLAASQIASARPNAATLRISADKSKLKFNVKTLKARHGKVTIRMANPSNLPHAVGIEGRGVDKDGKTVRKGGTSTVTVTLKKGRYTFYCPVPGHEAAGMKGTLTVT